MSVHLKSSSYVTSFLSHFFGSSLRDVILGLYKDVHLIHWLTVCKIHIHILNKVLIWMHWCLWLCVDIYTVVLCILLIILMPVLKLLLLDLNTIALALLRQTVKVICQCLFYIWKHKVYFSSQLAFLPLFLPGYVYIIL